MAKQPKPKVKQGYPTTPERDKYFKSDSTNLDNAGVKAKAFLRGSGSLGEFQAAKDTMLSIDKRRKGDKEFWGKMMPKK